MDKRDWIILSELARAGFFTFFAPLTGAAKGILRGVPEEFRAIQRAFERRVHERLAQLEDVREHP